MTIKKDSGLKHDICTLYESSQSNFFGSSDNIDYIPIDTINQINLINSINPINSQQQASVLEPKQNNKSPGWTSRGRI